MKTQMYVDNGNGIVTNMTEGLMWQKETPTVQMTWEEAFNYCENLNINCFTGWRLPTIQELLSLVDYSTHNPAINLNYFPDTVSSFYWSSTTYASNTSYAWGVNFNDGYGFYSNKLNSYYVRAVRDITTNSCM